MECGISLISKHSREAAVTFYFERKAECFQLGWQRGLTPVLYIGTGFFVFYKNKRRSILMLIFKNFYVYKTLKK